MRVIVIGAGVIGTAIAFRLNESGVDVTLADPQPGGGASWAAAGMLTPVGEAWHGEDDLLALLIDSARRYPDFVARVEHVSGERSGYRTTPTLICAADSRDLADLDGLHQIVRKAGLTSEALSVREARKLEPALSPKLAGAYFAQNDHQIDPRRFCAAMVGALENSGATIVREQISALEKDPGGPVIRTAGGQRFEADAVVVANGLGAGDLLPELDVMRPVYGDVLRLGPARFGPPLLTSVVRGVVNGRAVYAVPRADGSLVLGATAREDDDPRVSVGGVHNLLRDAVTLLPGIVDLSLNESTARARPGTPDNLPIVGEIAPGIIAATGFYRHGVLLTPWAADAVAGLLGVADTACDISACGPDRPALRAWVPA